MHQDTHITGLQLVVQGDLIVQPVTSRQLGCIFPLFGIVRYLYLTLHGFIDPVQVHFVKFRPAAQIHIQPFFTCRCTHPGTIEELGRLHLHQSVPIQEVRLRKHPVMSTRHLQQYTVGGVGDLFIESYRFIQFTDRHSRRLVGLLVRVGHRDTIRERFTR